MTMQRNATLDFLKVILSMMVVALHGHFLRDVYPDLAYFLENYLFRIAVPIFFMINGYFFSRVVTGSAKVWSWLKGILTIYLTWSVVYGYFLWPRTVGLTATAVDLLITLVMGYWHLWYLPATALAGLMIYFFRNRSDKVLVTILLGLYAVGLFMQYAGNYHWFSGSLFDAVVSNNLYYRNGLIFGLPMFGAGYLFAKTGFSGKISIRLNVVFFLIGISLLALECFINVHCNLPYSEGFDMLLALPIVCSALFLWAADAKRKTTSARLTEVSAVIFFIHPLFLLTLPKFGISSVTPMTVFAILGSLLMVPILIALNRRWRVFF